MSQTPEQKAAAEKAKAEKAAAAKAAAENEAAQKAKDGEGDADRPRTIVFDRSHPGYAYWPGNTAVLGKEHTDLLVNGGFAHFADAETTDAPTDEQR